MNQFVDCCITGDFKGVQYLYSLGGINIHIGNEAAFRASCEYGHLEIAKWLHSLGGINIHAMDECAFRLSCYKGHLEIAQWLHSLGGINIHADNECAFRWSCNDGHLEIVKWLHSFGGINIHANDEEAFIWSCRNGHLKIAQWLCSIELSYSYVIEDNEIIYIIKDKLQQLYESRGYDQLLAELNIPQKETFDGTCIICYDTIQYMIKLQCNHILCIECMYCYKYTYHNNTCPYCRQQLTIDGYSKLNHSNL